MATSTISNTITDPSGTAVGSVLVTARLMPTGGFRTAALTEVARVVSTTSNGSGAWSLVLERNADITPANTTYEITEYIPEASGGKRVWNITVGASNQTVLAALTSVLTAAQGSSYLTQASADARYQALGGLSSTSPNTIEPDDAASAGVSTSASRADHEHGIVTAAPSKLDLDGSASASEGVATSFSRSDHQHTAENDAWTTWSPTLTNLTLGNGTVTAKFIRIGRTIHYRFKFVLGSTSAVGTNPQFSLPVTASSDYVAERDVYGDANLNDTGTANQRSQVWPLSTTTGRIVYFPAGGAAANITATAPWTWTTNDSISVVGTYEAAS